MAKKLPSKKWASGCLEKRDIKNNFKKVDSFKKIINLFLLEENKNVAYLFVY